MTAACAVELAPTLPASSAGHASPGPAGPGTADLVVELAHDLRSPLSAILALSEVLYNGQAGPLTDAQSRYLALIHNAALGLCTLASDALDLARRGAPAGPGAPVPFSVREVLDGVSDLCQPLAAEKGLELRFEPLAAGDRRLGHPGAVSRVLLNLATNALKYTSQGHVVVAARAQERAGVTFSVSDTGQGLDAGAMRQLYEPFRSGGLGLAICGKLVHAMGAELRVETWPGRGTRFSFAVHLPRVGGGR